MTRIRVNPPLLRNESDELAHSSSNVSRLGQDVWNSASGAPSYDGQFGSRVRGIGSEAISRAQAIASRYAGLAGSLSTTANAFEAADSTGISGFEYLAVPPGWREQLALLQLYALMGALPIYLITIYLRLATLLGRNVWERRLIYALITRSSASSFWRGMTFKGIPVAATLDTLILTMLAYLRRFVGNSTGPTIQPHKPLPQQDMSADAISASRTLIETALTEKYGLMPSKYGNGQCVTWARQRRLDLGGLELPATGRYVPTNDLGASKFIQIYASSVVKIQGKDIDLAEIMPGTAIVWDKGGTKASPVDKESGHIAIVEKVQANGVWISQSNIKGHDVTFIPLEKLESLYFLSPTALPG